MPWNADYISLWDGSDGGTDVGWRALRMKRSSAHPYGNCFWIFRKDKKKSPVLLGMKGKNTTDIWKGGKTMKTVGTIHWLFPCDSAF